MSNLSVIGISTRGISLDSRHDIFQGVFESYMNVLVHAGAVPILIPPSRRMIGALTRCDGFLLAGGEDPGSSEWWESGSCPRHPIDPVRDAAEVEIIHFAHDHQRPLLGICRGMQLVNCVFGGTLSTLGVKRSCYHQKSSKNDDQDAIHNVRFESNSRLSTVIHDEVTDKVVSRHLSQVSTVGQFLIPVAWSPDGVIEGLEGKEWDFLGVQWHPEMTRNASVSHANLFRWLVKCSESAYRKQT